MSQDRVTQSNERLFKLYEKNLGQLGTKEFVETAIKLAAWLSNAKAYYTAARPNVCPLLGSFSCHFSWTKKIVNLLTVRLSLSSRSSKMLNIIADSAEDASGSHPMCFRPSSTIYSCKLPSPSAVFQLREACDGCQAFSRIVCRTSPSRYNFASVLGLGTYRSFRGCHSSTTDCRRDISREHVPRWFDVGDCYETSFLCSH